MLPVNAVVTDDMKFFNIVSQITGRETEKDLLYFAQQAEKFIALPKFKQGEDGQIVMSWKDVLSSWLVPNERASQFLKKKEATSPTVLFNLLITRNAPRVRDFSVSFLDTIHELVQPASFDDHQIVIEKFLDDLVERRVKEALTIQLAQICDVASYAPFSTDLTKNVKLRDELQIAINAKLREHEELISNHFKHVLGSEIGMSIIGSDPSLFASWKDGKPINATLSQLVNFAQEKFLDQERPLEDKLICLRYNNKGKSPIVTKADIEKSKKRKIELFNNTQVDKAQKTSSTQSPQQQNAVKPVSGKVPVVGQQQPSKPATVGREVAVHCSICLASPDSSKKEKAKFHLVDNCFDHPTNGEKNKKKFKFSKSKK